MTSTDARTTARTGSAPTPRRAVVVDVAYTRLEVSGRPVMRVGTLVESINHRGVVINGVRRPLQEAWTIAFADVLAGVAPAAVTLAHPTAWGFRRTSLLRNALRDAVHSEVEITTAPRAALIAESHMESSAQMCVVAECHDGRLDVHRLRRDDVGWAVSSTAVFDESLPDDEADAVLEPIVTDAVEAVLVDGDNRDRVAATLLLFADHTPTGRIAAVERVLLHRYGGARLSAPQIPMPTLNRRAAGADRPSRRILVRSAAAAVLLVAVIAALVVIAPWRADRSADGTTAAPDARPTNGTGAPAPTVTAQVGRVSVDVPNGWRRTGDPADATGAIPFTTFAAGADDRRLLLVQNAVRADSTSASVATSLRNRLDQRGTDVVTDFSPSTRYGDRDVISYRETPASGGQIRWYVVVASALQVSVGCQDGGRGQTVDPQCLAAVRSVRIAP